MRSYNPTPATVLLHESTENALRLYRPTPKRGPNFDVYADASRALIRQVNTLTPRGVITLFSILVQFLEWAIAQGLQPDLSKLLRPEQIERFVLTELKHLAESSRATRLSTLRRLGKIAAPKWWRRGSPTGGYRPRHEPYEQKTIDSYFLAARLQRFPRHRRFFHAVLLLGLGAGLQSLEIATAKPADLLYQNGYLAIRTSLQDKPSRIVPIRLEYVDQLLDLALEHPNERFCGSFAVLVRDPLGRTKTFIDMPSYLPPLIARRLRYTWMVSILNDGIDLASFLTLSASPDSRAIAELLPYLNTIPQDISWAAAAGDHRG